jgi:hypothetical protein
MRQARRQTVIACHTSFLSMSVNWSRTAILSMAGSIILIAVATRLFH